MALRIRFRFDGRCSVHARYNPERDGRPQHKDCAGCESLWVIHLYSGIARRKSENGEGLLTARYTSTVDDSSTDPSEAVNASSPGQEGGTGIDS